MCHSRPLFLLFSSFQYTVDSIQMFNINNFLPMTGFEPRTSGIRSHRSTNWATTTSRQWKMLHRHFSKCFCLPTFKNFSTDLIEGYDWFSDQFCTFWRFERVHTELFSKYTCLCAFKVNVNIYDCHKNGAESSSLAKFKGTYLLSTFNHA